MFRHNLSLIYRNFKRYKSSFFINLIGLSTGLACALLIYLWVNDELNVDKFHEKDRRLYQVMQNWREYTQGLLAGALAEEMPEVEYAASVIPSDSKGILEVNGILSVADIRIKASAQFVGEDYFNIFSYPLIQGNKNQVLADKYAMVISEELAMKLFNTTDNIIGKTLEWDGGRISGPYFVSGIFETPPANSSVQFDLLFNFELFLEIRPDLKTWYNNDPYTYLVLKEGTNIDQFNAKITDFVKSKHKDSNATLSIRKYSDKYLYGHYENGVQAGGRIDYVRLFSVIALFVLVIACINFMTLSTAKASRRIKEVGIKKVMGAFRKTLIFQYLGESMLMALLSLCMAFIMVIVFLPQFNEIIGKQLELNFDINLVLSLVGITLFTGLIAGSYPALYLSGFNPATVLKGKLNTSTGAPWTRKGLVVFQFTLSVIFIVSVLVIYKQMQFVHAKNLGYERDNILYFEREGRLNEGLEAFLAEVKKIPGVINASSIRVGITGGYGGFGGKGIDWPGKDPNNRISFWRRDVDYDLIETLGIKLVAGRSFSHDFDPDSTSIICNEAAIEVMGLKDPVGEKIKLFGRDRQIVGVVKNFHFESLYENMKPLVLRRYPNLNRVMVKIKAGREKETIDRLRDFYQEYNQGVPFDYKFLDEAYQSLYASEKRVAVLSVYFAGFAILISCLGLFGLAAFTAERRLKEIGIRKVLGASEFGIIYLLSSQFTKMVFVALCIALPVSYMLAKNWLDDFAYRIALEWWYFIGAGLLTLFIVWLTVSMQTIKAAQNNPLQCLRDE